MGTIISGEGWLLILHKRSPQEAKVATALLRMQILTGNRTGHLLVLGYEYTRRRICQAARYGRVADVVIECQRCYCQAKLAEWERSAHTSSEERRGMAATARKAGLGPEVLYLRPCPGNEYAQDMLESLRVK